MQGGGFFEFEAKYVKSLLANKLLWKTCPVHTLTEKIENGLQIQQSSVMLDSCLRNTWALKSHDYRDVIVFDDVTPVF